MLDVVTVGLLGSGKDEVHQKHAMLIFAALPKRRQNEAQLDRPTKYIYTLRAKELGQLTIA